MNECMRLSRKKLCVTTRCASRLTKPRITVVFFPPVHMYVVCGTYEKKLLGFEFCLPPSGAASVDELVSCPVKALFSYTAHESPVRALGVQLPWLVSASTDEKMKYVG